MSAADDIAFLERFRERLGAYLVAGESPTKDPLWGGRNLLKMEEAMKDPAFRALRTDINRMKGRAAQVLEGLSIGCTFKQYPPPAVGGPTITMPLFDLITDNRSMHSLDSTVFTDKIEEAIGRLQSQIGMTDVGPASPVFAVTDLAAALDFYTGKLGFEGDPAQGGENTVFVRRGEAKILLRADAEPRPATVSIEAGSPAALAEEFTAKGLTVGNPAAAVSEGFETRDPDGNILIFAKPRNANLD